MSNNKEGVVILFTPRTRIPTWLLNPESKVINISIGKKLVRALVIEGGQAKFVAKAGVYVKTPRTQLFRKAFSAFRVLEIRDFEGELIERNYYLCAKCFINTGQIILREQRSGEMINVIVRCSQCKHEWKLLGIEP